MHGAIGHHIRAAGGACPAVSGLALSPCPCVPPLHDPDPTSPFLLGVPRPLRLLYLDSGATAPGTSNGANAFWCTNCNIVVSGPEGRLWQAVATGLAEDSLPEEW